MHIDYLMTVKQACQAMDLTKVKSCSCCADNHKCTSLVVGAQTLNDNFKLRQRVSNFQSKDEAHCISESYWVQYPVLMTAASC